MFTRRESQFAAFVMGLAGIILTGTMIGMGGAYWRLAATGLMGLRYPATFGLTLVIGIVVLLDLVAFVVILDATVTVIQRLRGRI